MYLVRAIHEGLKRVSTPDELRRIYPAPSRLMIAPSAVEIRTSFLRLCVSYPELPL